MAPVCTKCNKNLQGKDTLKCFKCKQVYDVQCAGRSPRLFQLMSPDRKKSWVCLKCGPGKNTLNQFLTNKPTLEKKPDDNNMKTNNLSIKNPSPVPGMSSKSHQPARSCDEKVFHSANSTPSQNNVTHRKKITQNEDLISTLGVESNTSLSYDSDHSNEPEISSLMNRSLPYVKTSGEDSMEVYKTKLNSLELRLLSAELEIQNLILENGNLKKIIHENEQTIKKLTHICSSTSKKIKNKLPSNKLKGFKLDLSHSQEKDNGKVSSRSIEALADPNQELQQISPIQAHQAATPAYQHARNVTPQRDHATRNAMDKKSIQLCVLSNDNRCGILKAMNTTFDSNFKYCHYSTPNTGITELLCNLTHKLENFTMNDYCIIFIGEADLRDSQNSIQLINCIRESLLKITHTNKIICLPTYICGALIHNYKVEMFGNLLAMDMQSNNYAYLFDTNRDLTLEMFSHSTGKLTKLGMKTTFLKIKQFMEEVDAYLNYYGQKVLTSPIQAQSQNSSVDICASNDLFRV